MEKIYEYFKKDELFLQFSVEDIKQIIKSANKNGFLLIQDDYRSVPRKIMTSKGIIEIILDYDSENDVVSKNTGDVMYYSNRFGYDYIGEKLFKIIYENLLIYLYSKPMVLLSYINEKHKLNLEMKDIKILKDHNVLKKEAPYELNKLFDGLKRNKRVIKGITYVKVENNILEINNNNVTTMYV
ncbi:hypothetical protein [Cetobacterium sp.]|uniref:hypothetical protein n=1 Tax=Cetobacterium sp. TaxID=2071632 RepID=UPI003F3BF9AA